MHKAQRVTPVPAALFLPMDIRQEWLPRLPFDQVDVLIVDEIGKNISGSGMDTNVIGRKRNDRRAMDDETPRVLRIFVRQNQPDPGEVAEQGGQPFPIGIGQRRAVTSRPMNGGT